MSSTTVTFIGGDDTGNVFHSLWAGTAQGSNNLPSGPLSNHSKTISGLPNQGTIYARYWSTSSSSNSSDPNTWSFTDQTYTIAVGSMSRTTTNTPVNIPASKPPISTPPVSSAVSSEVEPARQYTRQYQRQPDLPSLHGNPAPGDTLTDKSFALSDKHSEKCLSLTGCVNERSNPKTWAGSRQPSLILDKLVLGNAGKTISSRCYEYKKRE